MNIATQLQAQVDAQLMEQGAFAPLDLLFNSGRLMYGDYEAWRRGEIELLDELTAETADIRCFEGEAARKRPFDGYVVYLGIGSLDPVIYTPTDAKATTLG